MNKFDFQEGYTIGFEDDQSSYVEKKIFKFKYRRALDSPAEYERKNQRMIDAQKKRFTDNKTQELIENVECAFVLGLSNDPGLLQKVGLCKK